MPSPRGVSKDGPLGATRELSGFSKDAGGPSETGQGTDADQLVRSPLSKPSEKMPVEQTRPSLPRTKTSSTAHHHS